MDRPPQGDPSALHKMILRSRHRCYHLQGWCYLMQLHHKLWISTLTDFTFRVLEMRTSFEHERAEWKAQAARSLQSSKLTRSLGRSRSQSVGRARAQLKDMGGVGFLATKTLMGNQLAAPTVHARTPSDGTHGTQTRSGTSHARTNSSGGCSASRSKATLRGLCVSDDKMSPQDERNDGFSRIDSRGKGVRTETAPLSAEVPSTPSPQVTNNSDVGVALSSPLQSSEVDQMVPTKSSYAQDHPYVQSGDGRSQHGRSGSDYAGPHLSAVAVALRKTPHHHGQRRRNHQNSGLNC